jgi:hypothetical protein
LAPATRLSRAVSPESEVLRFLFRRASSRLNGQTDLEASAGVGPQVGLSRTNPAE